MAFPSLAPWLSAERPRCEIFPLVGDAHRGFPQPGFIWLWLLPALASHPGIWPGAKKQQQQKKEILMVLYNGVSNDRSCFGMLSHLLPTKAPAKTLSSRWKKHIFQPEYLLRETFRLDLRDGCSGAGYCLTGNGLSGCQEQHRVPGVRQGRAGPGVSPKPGLRTRVWDQDVPVTQPSEVHRLVTSGWKLSIGLAPVPETWFWSGFLTCFLGGRLLFGWGFFLLLVSSLLAFSLCWDGKPWGEGRRGLKMGTKR